MSMIQIRNVPEPLNQKLKQRAAMNGKTLSDFLKDELAKLVAKPTLSEFAERVRYREAVDIEESSVLMVAEERLNRFGGGTR